MNYLSTRQASEKWGITPRRIQVLCAEGRIDGAIRIGEIWGIPEIAPKPTDARIKSGKYIKMPNTKVPQSKGKYAQGDNT